MLNYETILSSYDDKLTLMQWLKKVEAALQNAAATSFEVVKRGNATIAFKLNFADGTALESGDIVLQQGESVESGAIVNGHLILTLTNGDQLDTGNLFNGNADINGQLLVRGDVWAQGDIDSDGKITGSEIVETMTGYSAVKLQAAHWNCLYCGVVKNGNKITFAISGEVPKTSSTPYNLEVVRFYMPQEVADKLIASYSTALAVTSQPFYKDDNTSVNIQGVMRKDSPTGNNIRLVFAPTTGMANDNTYYFRYEVTFLLSDSLL